MNLDKDYHIVESWWKERNWTPIQKELLSKYGFIVNDVAAMWLYPFNGSKSCMVGFPISNPTSTKEDRDRSLDLLFKTISKVAKDMGYKYIMTHSNIKPVKDRLEKLNFFKTDENVDVYFGGL